MLEARGGMLEATVNCQPSTVNYTDGKVVFQFCLKL
jgi:hypothetical protein